MIKGYNLSITDTLDNYDNYKNSTICDISKTILIEYLIKQFFNDHDVKTLRQYIEYGSIISVIAY